MFSWTLNAPSNEDTKHCENIIGSILSKRRAEIGDLENVQTILNRMTMRTCMRQVIETGIEKVKKEPSDASSLSFLVETVAGIQYACDDPSVGKMKHIRRIFRCGDNDHAIRFLKSFATSALKEQMYKSRDIWFRLRVNCMDAYALGIILGENNENGRDMLYYAGMSHTRNIERYLLENQFATAVQDDNSLVEVIRPMAMRGNISHISALKMSSGKTLMFLGEDHNITSLTFAREIVLYLKSRCVSDASHLLFMIEKHISNNKDKIQTELMCNQPDLAIHASRCDAFMDSSDRCTKLDILAVDNRHTDMGFVRIEVFDLWDDRAFRKASIHFFKCALQSVVNFCDAMLECRFK